MSDVELLFLGTGTSAGVPMIGCHCAVCTSSDPRDRRHRPSVCISYDATRVLVDTTPELRIQCITRGIDMIDAVVFTHAHADHIMGLDDLRRFNEVRQGPIDAWADSATFQVLDDSFGYAFGPASPELKVSRPHLIHRLICGPFQIAGKVWTPIRLLHGDVPVLGFRIGRLAYCTDVSSIPDKSFDLLRDLDVLVLDALRHKPHPTHFSLQQAVETARKIGARQTFFTHIAHAMAHGPTNQSLPHGMQLAYDGQRVTARP